MLLLTMTSFELIELTARAVTTKRFRLVRFFGAACGVYISTRGSSTVAFRRFIATIAVEKPTQGSWFAFQSLSLLCTFFHFTIWSSVPIGRHAAISLITGSRLGKPL